jgi:hypothetical protein
VEWMGAATIFDASRFSRGKMSVVIEEQGGSLPSAVSIPSHSFSRSLERHCRYLSVRSAKSTELQAPTVLYHQPITTYYYFYLPDDECRRGTETEDGAC